MESQLSSYEKCELMNALISINTGEVAKAKQNGQENINTDYIVDGLTYEQVISLAKDYKPMHLRVCKK